MAGNDLWWERLKAEVIDSGLCTHCGSCVGLASSLAFSDEERPIPVKRGKTSVSEAAFRACPGREIDYPTLNEVVYGRLPKSWLLGNHEGLFVGYATDSATRRNSSSGGVITQTLLHLLEKKEIDGAIVLNQDRERPYISRPVIATSEEELRASSQSVYVVTPMNTILREAALFKGKLAYVGLPDQVASVRKLQQTGRFSNITFIMGPYTGTSLYRGALKSYLRSHGVPSLDSIAELRYRAGEWPGHLRIALKDGRVLSTPKFYYNYLIPFYITDSSLYQCDFTNELTDISVGDAWSPEYEKQGKGFSVITARTKRGLAILEEMEQAGLVHLDEIPEEKALSMHGHMLDFKKRGSFIRLAWKDRFLLKGRPFYGYEPESIPLGRKAVEAFNFSIFMACRRRLARSIMEKIPIGMMGPAFDAMRKAWKGISKPTKRRGLAEQRFRIVSKSL